MKKPLLLFILAFVVFGASAQSQKVKVTSAAEGDLPFSYIYINSKIFGEADKNAQVMIPRTQLKDGDTISATHIGFNKGHIIYKGYQSNGYTINMTADDLEKITVYGRKETRQEFREIEPKPQFISGVRNYTFRVVLDINGKEYLRGNYYAPESLLVLDDKYTPLLADKRQADFLSDFVTYLFLEIFQDSVYDIITDRMALEWLAIKLTKTAEDDNTRTFLLSQGKGNRQYPHLIASNVFMDVDKKSSMVVSSRMDFQQRIGRLQLTASYSYGKQYFLINGFYTQQDVRYADVVEATYTMRDGTVYTVDIYDTRLRSKDELHKFNKQKSVCGYVATLPYWMLEKGMLNAEKKGYWPWEKWFKK